MQGAFMQVFVRSYQDSDGDGIGDLKGLTRRLDYLRDLGVRGLWLLPVMRSQDHDHGYAVTHYREIESVYGTLADLDELLRQAHARGMGVVLDYVLNHSAAEHPAFQASRTDPSGNYRNWYVWQASAPTGWNVFGVNPWRSTPNGTYYAPFWDQMPDWNLRNAEVRDFHRHNLRFWLNRGVDGFRIDAAGMLYENGPNAWDHQPENLSYLRDDLAAELGTYARRFMVCEAPGAPLLYASACGHAFAFGQQDWLVAAAGGNASALADLATAPADPPLSPFLSNHDSAFGERPFHRLGGDLGALKMAAALLLLREGTPFLYYGEEIGMGHGQGLSGDPRLRSPMSWTASNQGAEGFSTGAPYRALAVNVATHNVAAQLADPQSLLNHYKTLLALRNAQPALSRGRTEVTHVQGGVLGYWRKEGSSALFIVVHTARNAAQATLSGFPTHATLDRLFGTGGGVRANAQGQLVLDLPAQSVHVFQLAP